MDNENWNTGDCNTGNWNTGDWNTGNWNTGDRNTGNRNTGNWNTGSCNTEDWNTGNCNTGSWNTGDRNTGDCNTGNWNTGDWNTGNWNTGDRNTGNRNTGNWNTVNRETGFFNTIQRETIRVFNEDCDLEVWDNCTKPSFLFFRTAEWVSSDKMSEEEKTAYPTHKTTGGYLKKYEYKEAFKKSYDSASEEDKALLLDLPNFNAEVFFEISGIDVRKPSKQDKINEIQAQINALQKELNDIK